MVKTLLPILDWLTAAFPYALLVLALTGIAIIGVMLLSVVLSVNGLQKLLNRPTLAEMSPKLVKALLFCRRAFLYVFVIGIITIILRTIVGNVSL